MRDFEREKWLAGEWRVSDSLGWALRRRRPPLAPTHRRVLVGLVFLADRWGRLGLRRSALARRLLVSPVELRVALRALEARGLISVLPGGPGGALDIVLLVLGFVPHGRGAQMDFGFPIVNGRGRR